MPSNSTVIVNGANGFLGQAVAQVLTAQGCRVIEATRTRPIFAIAAQDLAQADSVVWLASRVSPKLAEQRPELCANDLEDFRDYLERLQGRPKQPRTVLASSGGTVYDPSRPPPYQEQSPVVSSSAYSQLKLDQEQLASASGLPTTVLRLSNPYGPRQRLDRGQGVIAHWLDSLLRHQPILVHGNSVRDYVFIDDTANALARAATSPELGPAILNIGSGKGTSLEDLLSVVIETAPEKISETATIERLTPRTFDRDSVWLDVSLASTSIGWVPEVSLNAGVSTMWRHALAKTIS